MKKDVKVTEPILVTPLNYERVHGLRRPKETYNDVITRLLACWDKCGLVFDLDNLLKTGDFVPLEEAAKELGLENKP